MRVQPVSLSTFLLSIIQRRDLIFFGIVSYFLFLACCLLPTAYSFSQGIWTKKANFGGTIRRAAVGFSIGDQGYIGTGSNKDFWEWDRGTNVWTQKADFGGGFRSFAVGFSIGDKGYIGVGEGNISPYFKNDFWEWDQTTNVWTQKADFGGAARSAAVGFSIGAKGYIGTGLPYYKNDFWEWDQATNTWTQKADFSGTGRWTAASFSIGTKGYIGTGMDSTVPYYKQDFWEWDQASNTWTQKADFGGTARAEATGFSTWNYGYIGLGTTAIGTGTVSDLWKYDPSTNIWISVVNFGGGLRELAVGFSIGCKGYIGTGWINDTRSQKDFWEYCPDPACCNNTLGASISFQNILCNGQCTGSVTSNPYGGTNPYTYNWNNGQTTQTITGLCADTYTVTVTDAAGDTSAIMITITQPPPITATVTATNSACGSNKGTVSAAATGGSPSYTYLWNPGGQTTSAITGLVAGTYTAIVSDANNCTLSQTVTVVSSGSVTTTSQSASICSGSTYTLPGGTVVSATGVYMDTLTSIVGCDSIITTNLIVNPNPMATVFSIPPMAGQIVTITQGQNVTLTVSGGGTYSWSNGTNGSSIMVTPVVTTIYCVTITDANNCTDTACVTVTIEPIYCSNAGELYLPNAFSPNGDGENDKLRVYYGNMDCIKTFNLVIYNRWGEKVFETTMSDSKWNGTYRGKPINTAVFVYYLEATLSTGEKVTKKGNVSILR